MLKSSCLGHTVSTRIVTNIKKLPAIRCNKVKNYNEPFNDFYHIKVWKLFSLYFIFSTYSIPNPLLMNPIPTQIYMIPNPESNPDSSFDSGFGIAPGLLYACMVLNLLDSHAILRSRCMSFC